MYLNYYGFREAPFELTSNPKYLFFTEQHREALTVLEYGLSSGKAVTVLIGDAGTGKTTLLQAALKSERCRNIRTVYLSNPTLTRAEFVETLAAQFDLGSGAKQSKATMLAALEAVLRERRARGEITALVVDEAQSLSYELLEELRLLTNMETPTEKLLPLALAGQSELTARLNEPELRQLKQRVALRCQIGPLTLQDTAGYISSRIRTAGGDTTRLFTREAVTLIHEHSRGIPRTISVICDNCLVSGLALSKKPVNSDIVLEVCRDFDLSAAASPPARRIAAISEPAAAEGSDLLGAATGTLEEFEKPEKTSGHGRVLSMLGLR
jgi:type II secretory pathway predicted ATPase ExeA